MSTFKLGVMAALAISTSFIAQATAATVSFQQGVSPDGIYTVPNRSIFKETGFTPFDLVTGNYLASTRSLLSFDLKAAGGLVAGDQIDSVSLQLTKWQQLNWDGLSATNRLLSIHVLTTDFDPATTTWTQADGSTAWASEGGDYQSTVLSTVTEAAAIGGTVTFASSSEFVSAAQDALDNNNGVLNLIIIAPNAEVRPRAYEFVRFHHSNADVAADRPELIVTTVVPEPSTLGMIGVIGMLLVRRRII